MTLPDIVVVSGIVIALSTIAGGVHKRGHNIMKSTQLINVSKPILRQIMKYSASKEMRMLAYGKLIQTSKK